MARQLWIADKLREYGLDVREVEGWRDRGVDSWAAPFRPAAVGFHHTAAASGKAVPSLGVCVHGRPDLAGPLCNVLVGRDLVCYVIASGVANHAGAGTWRGLAGNSRSLGVEVEHTGYLSGPKAEPWTLGMLDVCARVGAALCDGLGVDASWTFAHFEWTNRKTDPVGWDMDGFRRWVGQVIEQHKSGAPVGGPRPMEVPAVAVTRIHYVDATTGAQATVTVQGDDLYVVDHRDTGASWLIGEEGTVMALGKAEAAAVDAVDGDPGFIGLSPHLANIGGRIVAVRAHGADGFHADVDVPGIPGFTVPYAVPADAQIRALQNEVARLQGMIDRAKAALA